MRKQLMKNPHKVLPQLWATIVASWGYFCLGTVRGWSAPGIPSINRTLNDEYNNPNASDFFEMSNADLTWVASLPPLCSLIGALLISAPMQIYGRRKALIWSSIPFVFGFLIMGFTIYGRHKAQLYVGRIITGLVAGATTPASQIYITECSSPSIRGTLGSMTATSLALGIVVTYIIGAFVEHHVLGWILSGFPFVLFIGMILLPETPVWLLAHGQEEEARKALQRLRGSKTNIEPEFKRMLESQQNAANSGQNKVGMKDIMKGSILKPFGISMGIMFFQQFSGINAIVNNTSSIFEDAGSSIKSSYATIIVGFVQLIFTIISGFLVDKFGRKILLLVSGLFCALSLAALGAFFHLQAQWGVAEASVRLGWLPLVSLIVFFAAYSSGYSNVPFIIMGELFPARYRSILGPLSSSFNLLCAFAVVRAFPEMFPTMGKNGTFWFFAACMVVSLFFVAILLPETKGKTFDEIERLFRRKGKQYNDNVTALTTGSSINNNSASPKALEGGTLKSKGLQQLASVVGDSGHNNTGYLRDCTDLDDPDSDDNVDLNEAPPVYVPV